MKNKLIILFLFISVAVNATTYYVATNGNDSNPGTITQPWATWNYGFNHLSAGDILYIRGGTYTGVAGGSSNKFGVRVDGLKGTSGSHIKISAYSGETPVLDCSALNTTTGQNVGIGIYNSTYLDLIGLTVINVTQHAVNAYAAPGFYESNVSYITHTLCTIHHCGDGFTLKDSYNYIYYTNCDVYEIADTFDDPSGALPGSLANGYYCAPSTGAHVYYTGCRAWNCSDDGWDFYGGNGYIEITDCWAFNNGWCNAGGPIAYTKGDGSGFKLGPSTVLESGFQRIVKNSIAAGNLGPGIDQNASSSTANVRHAIYNCITANNTGEGFQYYWDHVSTFRNNIAFGNGSNYEFGSGSTIDHNSWQSGLTCSTADFISTDVAELARPRKADGSLPDIGFMHLVTNSDLIDAGVNIGMPYNGTAPDLGAFEAQSGSTIIIPVYVSSIVENATPNTLDITYNSSLAIVVPASTAFSVKVNTVARTVNVVTISGTKVRLTLSSPVVYGDVVTVSYTKPATSPVQTASGGQAATLTAQTVVNNVNAGTQPVYVSSSVENATPNILDMTYNTTLANIIPAVSAFSVLVNSVVRTVNTVALSGAKVQLTLSSAIKLGDIITVAYTKPASNPLQGTTGGQAISLASQSVINNLINPAKDATPVTIKMTLSPLHIHRTVNILLEYSASLATQAASITPELIRIMDLSGKLFIEKLLVTGVTNVKIPLNLRAGIYIVQLTGNGLLMASQKIKVY